MAQSRKPVRSVCAPSLSEASSFRRAATVSVNGRSCDPLKSICAPARHRAHALRRCTVALSPPALLKLKPACLHRSSPIQRFHWPRSLRSSSAEHAKTGTKTRLFLEAGWGGPCWLQSESASDPPLFYQAAAAQHS